MSNSNNNPNIRPNKNPNKNHSTQLKTAIGFKVLKSGMLSLIQDQGRFGHYNLGLTNGGPLDPNAFFLANALLSKNQISKGSQNQTMIEITLGGLELQSQVNQRIVLTGANMPLTINGQLKENWQTHNIQKNDIIKIGHATNGLRAYLAVQDGLQIESSFESRATVCREKIGGLNGQALKEGDVLACKDINPISNKQYKIESKHQPSYPSDITLRVIEGYQHQEFSHLDKQRFYSNSFTVSNQIDRMGYRLKGEAIHCDIDGILSEGTCKGAIQIPADGQPIVLLNDRQTIGGYPKIGSVISVDCAKLAQVRSDATVRFQPISIEKANNLFHLNHYKLNHLPLKLIN